MGNDIVGALGGPKQLDILEDPTSQQGVNNVQTGINNVQDIYASQTSKVTPVQTTWENQATIESKLGYQQDVNTAKQTSLQQAQNLTSTGQQLETSLQLGEYTQQQSIDKAGWTGGYLLDQNRQAQYLKAGIQAQMFNAQELQKYGYESQLDAARLAYQLGKEQLAYQYYKDAYAQAENEAQRTGYFVAPEIRDMLTQYEVAQQRLNLNPKDAEATKVMTAINKYFEDEGIDPENISTFSQVTFEREQYNQAVYEATLNNIDNKFAQFIKVDANGETVTENGRPVLFDFETANSSDIAQYVSSGETAQSQFSTYINWLGQASMNGYYTSIGRNADGTLKEETSAEGLETYLSTNDQVLSFLNSLNDEDKKTIATSLGEEEFFVRYTGTDGKVYAQSYILDKDGNPKRNGRSQDISVKTTTINGEEIATDTTEYNKQFSNNWKTSTLSEKQLAVNQSYGENIVDLTTSYSISDVAKDFSSVTKGIDDESGQSTYAAALIKSLENGEVPNGAIVSFNFGNQDTTGNFWDQLWGLEGSRKYNSATYLVMDGKLYAMNSDTTKYNPAVVSNIWTPKGYNVKATDETAYAKFIAETDKKIKTEVETYTNSLTDAQREALAQQTVTLLTNEQLKAAGLTDAQIQAIKNQDPNWESIIGTTAIGASAVTTLAVTGALTAAVNIGTLAWSAAAGTSTLLTASGLLAGSATTGVFAAAGTSSAVPVIGWIVAAALVAAGTYMVFDSMGKNETFTIQAGDPSSKEIKDGSNTYAYTNSYKGWLSQNLYASIKND